MDFELKTLSLQQAAGAKCDVLVLLLAEPFRPMRDALSQVAAQALKAGDIELKPGKLLQLYRPPELAATRVVLAGAGDGSPRQVRTAVLAAIGAIKASKARRVVLCFAAAAEPLALRAAVHACADASYVYTTTKSKPEPRIIERVLIGVPNAGALQEAFSHATAAVEGIEFAKEWANRPANHATPTLLAGAARMLARERGIACQVLGPAEIEKLGMGAFLAVARGSAEPPRFIVLRYEGAARRGSPIVLVGKGITFDTGGISLKPGAEMDEMKYDMGGAASVLGVFRALASLRPALDVIGLIPSCENMPDGRALKPSDVITSMGGQTIEVLNTDAEGRLILCDALTYAERFKPAAVVDVATLTGACVIALGGIRSGMYSPDDALAQELLAAGDAALDPCWRMPLDDDYAEGLKSNFADVANIAGRAGGSITAAKFLQRFAGKFAWGHLDIAGTAWKSGAAKGATGRPVGLLLEWLINRAAAKPPAVGRRRARAT